MEIRDLLIALNTQEPLSLWQLYKKFNIDTHDEKENAKILESCLARLAKKKLESGAINSFKKETDLAKKGNIDIVTIFDKNYPELLKNIFDPPCVLYVKGVLKKNEFCPLAVVGSRRASFSGINFARKITSMLAMKGMTIISGLARGIDSAAHTGCLEAEGRTIAVLGSGFGNLYPRGNEKLAEQITKRGAVITEFPYFTAPLRYNFPRRNRIISGMSAGVVVVEAAERSGSLITADFALEQGREVFAVPGFANAATSKGANKLIKQGAVLIEDEDDIINALPDIIKEKLIKDKAGENQNIKEKLDTADLKVYNFLTNQPVAVDNICQSLDLTAPEVLKILLNLQLKGLVEQVPGNLFLRK